MLDDERDDECFDGVFQVRYNHPVLFSKMIEITPGRMPKLQPDVGNLTGAGDYVGESADRNNDAPPAPRIRPSWDDYFLGLAFVVSRRSPDPSTQHGCVLVDRFNHVVGMGYNGFPRGVDDSGMPLSRPEKYDWVIHAEENAIGNAVVNLREIGSVTTYVTGQICFQCAKKLSQAGVTNWVMANRRGFSSEVDRDAVNFVRLVDEVGVSIRWVDPDLDWLVDRNFLGDIGVDRS